MSQNFDELWKRGKEFLGVEHAIISGAMSWVSDSDLVAAVSNAGAFGVIAGSAMPPKELEKVIVDTQAKTSKPFGVNIITMHPQIEELIDVCIANKVTHVVLAGGIPTKSSIEKLTENGIKTMTFAPNIVLAQRSIKYGVGAIIIEGTEAGGHVGPVSTAVLAQEILPNIKEVPVFIAGGIASGEMVTRFLQMGASGVQMGTVFVCSTECNAHENFKNAFIKAKSKDAQTTTAVDYAFPIIPVRALVNKEFLRFNEFQTSVIEEFKKGLMSKHDAQIKIETYWSGALRRAVVDGDVETGSIMAGQSVGLVSEIRTVQEIIDDILAQARACL